MVTSSETQGQLEGAGKKLGRRKDKNEVKSPWGQSFNGPLPMRCELYKMHRVLDRTNCLNFDDANKFSDFRQNYLYVRFP